MYIRDCNELGFICSQWPLNPEHPTLLLIHGAGLNHAQWQAQINGLKADANVIAIDLPGHALSAHHEGEQTIRSYADEVFALVQHLSIRPILVGHSMGGAVCLDFALRYSEQLAALVLLNTGARLKVVPELMEQIQQDFPGFVEMMTRQALTDGADASIITPFADLLLQNDLHVVLNDFSACNQFDFMEQLHQIHSPALVLCAEMDQMTPPKYGQYLSDHLPDSCFEVLHGTAHLSPMEHPDEVNDAIRNFLSRL